MHLLLFFWNTAVCGVIIVFWTIITSVTFGSFILEMEQVNRSFDIFCHVSNQPITAVTALPSAICKDVSSF